jgi:hypothetical protein
VKVTFVPEQIVVAVAETETAGVSAPLTVIVIVFDAAVVGVAHDKAEVMVHVRVFPLAKAALEYVAELVPTLEPLSFH